MLDEIKNIQTSKKILRNFGLILSVILVIFGGISLWKGGGAFAYLFGGALVVSALSFAAPMALKFIYWPWMVIATIIGWTITRIILILTYYLMFTPISLVLKIMGKDLLDQRIEPDKKSYWAQRESRTFLKEDFERQF